jgi:hypothetical protein
MGMFLPTINAKCKNVKIYFAGACLPTYVRTQCKL